MNRILCICSGYGGLSAAFQEVLGGVVVAVADNDPGASRILAHRYPGVPNLGDLTQVDWEVVAGELAVDVVTAGFP